MTTTTYDDRAWEYVRSSRVMRDAMSGAQLSGYTGDVEAVARDTFLSLLHGEPVVSAKGTRHEGFVRRVMNAPDITALRGAVGDDLGLAATAAAYIVASLDENSDEDDGNGGGGSGDGMDFADMLSAIGDEYSAGQPSDAVAAALAVAISRAQDAVETLEDLTETVLGHGDNAISKPPVPIRVRNALADALRDNPRLKHIMRVAGRMRRLSHGKAVRSPIADDIVGVELGANVRRLTAAEFGNLAMPGTRTDFYRRFSQKQTLVKKPGGMAPLGYGPILLIIDGSGSMSNLIDGKPAYVRPSEPRRIEWAKGVMSAMIGQARKERRDLYVIQFDDEMNGEWVFRRGEASTDDYLAAINTFEGGFTHYRLWMERARQILAKPNWKKADIVLLSDGVPSDQTYVIQNAEEWNAWRKETSVRSYGVMIGNDSMHYLSRICDETHQLSSMLDETALAGMMNLADE